MSDLVMTGAEADEIWPLVRDHHYSATMPASTSHAFAWREPGGLFGETGTPLAGVLYGNPVGRGWPPNCLELTRLIRSPELAEPLSAFVAWTLRWLKRKTDCNFVLSYADEEQGHHGGIYQALGFLYVAYRHSKHFAFFRPDGSKVHARSLNQRYGTSKGAAIAERDPLLERRANAPKFLYVKPLNIRPPALLRQFDWAALPYPKPNAACPLDDPAPTGLSGVRPPEAAPISEAA